MRQTVVLPNYSVFVREVLIQLFPDQFIRSRVSHLHEFQYILNHFIDPYEE